MRNQILSAAFARAILHYHFPMRMFVLFLPALLFAQPAARLQTGYASIRPPILKADLTFISSDALDGRMSLERGSEVAIQWIAGEFAKAGLKPAVGDSYLQPVPLIEFTTDRNLTSLSIIDDKRRQVFHAPDATANFPDEISVAAAVVFAGYGITAPELNYDDYAGIDAKGKSSWFSIMSRRRPTPHPSSTARAIPCMPTTPTSCSMRSATEPAPFS